MHVRYAIDKKPTKYKAINGKEYNSEEVDWRELIYQMALDYRRYYYYDGDNETMLNISDSFYDLIRENNGKVDDGRDRYPKGKTGYEQYYVDMEGFWRQIYCPKDDYRNITLSKSDFTNAGKGVYYTRKFNDKTLVYDYTDIKDSSDEYNTLVTYYTPG